MYQPRHAWNSFWCRQFFAQNMALQFFISGCFTLAWEYFTTTSWISTQFIYAVKFHLLEKTCFHLSEKRIENPATPAFLPFDIVDRFFFPQTCLDATSFIFTRREDWKSRIFCQPTRIQHFMFSWRVSWKFSSSFATRRWPCFHLSKERIENPATPAFLPFDIVDRFFFPLRADQLLATRHV